MSLPVTDEEKGRFNLTSLLAGLTDNVVSTACPECGVRFVLLAHLDACGWHLRCVRCGWTGTGELKEKPRG